MSGSCSRTPHDAERHSSRSFAPTHFKTLCGVWCVVSGVVVSPMTTEQWGVHSTRRSKEPLVSICSGRVRGECCGGVVCVCVRGCLFLLSHRWDKKGARINIPDKPSFSSLESMTGIATLSLIHSVLRQTATPNDVGHSKSNFLACPSCCPSLLCVFVYFLKYYPAK